MTDKSPDLARGLMEIGGWSTTPGSMSFWKGRMKRDGKVTAMALGLALYRGSLWDV